MLSSRILQLSSATLRPRLQLSATSSGSSWGRIRRFSQVPPSTPPPTPKPPTSSSASSAESQSSLSQMWAKFVGPKVMPERYTFAWYREMVLICTVFAITGSSTMLLVRPAVKQGLGLEGSFREGPWSFRICSIVVMTPIYASLLVVVGTVFGRHHYFRHFSVKMWSRFGIPPEMIDASYHQTKKTFKKW
eukprot:Nitzschia sp. Nitz4//scaffold128_size63911//46437//47097//NITZ4_006225-RA/size63911-snap-gene-0.60-mRNA-1//1//CDS//3329534850//5534//frame0